MHYMYPFAQLSMNTWQNNMYLQYILQREHVNVVNKRACAIKAWGGELSVLKATDRLSITARPWPGPLCLRILSPDWLSSMEMPTAEEYSQSERKRDEGRRVMIGGGNRWSEEGRHIFTNIKKTQTEMGIEKKKKKRFDYKN